MEKIYWQSLVVLEFAATGPGETAGICFAWSFIASVDFLLCLHSSRLGVHKHMAIGYILQDNILKYSVLSFIPNIIQFFINWVLILVRVNQKHRFCYEYSNETTCLKVKRFAQTFKDSFLPVQHQRLWIKRMWCKLHRTRSDWLIEEQKLWCIVVTFYVQFEEGIQVDTHTNSICVYNHLYA